MGVAFGQKTSQPLHQKMKRGGSAADKLTEAMGDP
jgi:hypothetical protein